MSQTNMATNTVTTSSISMHAYYLSDAGTKVSKAVFYCNGTQFASISASSTGSNNWTTSVVSKTGLSAGTSYTFAVRFYIYPYNGTFINSSFTAWTTSGYSCTKTFTTTALSKPTSISLTGTAGLNNMSLSWTGGTGASFFEVYVNGSHVNRTTSKSYNVTGLSSGTSYTFMVVGVNDGGETSASITKSTLSPPDPPDPVYNLAGTPTQNTMYLTWSGGTGANKFEIYVNGTYVANTMNRYYTVTGLQPSTSYTFMVVAVNSSGTESASLTKSTSAPPAPTAITLTGTAGIVNMNLAWTGGTGATKFEIYVNGTYVASTTSMSYNVTNLAANTSYTFMVVGVNDGGTRSATLIKSTLAAPIPTPPTNVRAAVTGLNVVISFTKGTDTNNTYCDMLEEAETYNYVTSGTSFTLSVPYYNHTYSYRLVSANQYEYSSWTSTYTFTTGNPPIPPTPSAAPTFTGRGDASVTLTWGSSAAATGYRIYYRVSTSAVWNYKEFTGTTGVISGMLYGTKYDFYAVAFNVSGVSAPTSTNQGTTRPQSPTISIASQTHTSVNIKVNALTGGFTYVRVYKYNATGTQLGYLDVVPTSVGGNANFTGLTAGVTYKFDAQTFLDVGALWSNNKSAMLTVTTIARPANWAWSYNIVAGGNVLRTDVAAYGGNEGSAYIMTATEWNNFRARINQFRAYKNLAIVAFREVSPEEWFGFEADFNSTGDIVNFNGGLLQAYNAIKDMVPAMPAIVNENWDVKASYFITMRDSLNSIV